MSTLVIDNLDQPEIFRRKRISGIAKSCGVSYQTLHVEMCLWLVIKKRIF